MQSEMVTVNQIMKFELFDILNFYSNSDNHTLCRPYKMPHSVSDLGVQNSNAFKCLKLETILTIHLIKTGGYVWPGGNIPRRLMNLQNMK